MDGVLILNGSPRAPKSNSKRYAQLFAQACSGGTEYEELLRADPARLVRQMEQVSRVLLVFPLYVDGVPVTLLNLFRILEEHPPKNRPALSVLINCGFLEWQQNDVAVDIVGLFAKKNGYPMGAVLKIGGGEAILNTPFRGMVRSKIKQLARAVEHDQVRELRVTMPLPKGLFIRASRRYWENYGKSNGVSREQMQTMEIQP